MELHGRKPDGQARRWWHRLFSFSTPHLPEQRQTSPEHTAGVLSRLTFTWMGPLMATGFRRPLQLNDIPLLNPSRSVEEHLKIFDAHFCAPTAAEGGEKALFTALHRTFGREFWIGGLYRLLADLFAVASAYSLRYLIQFILESYYARLAESHQEPPPLRRGAGLLGGIVMMQIALSLCQNHFLYRSQMVGGQVRALLTSKILDKSLSISRQAQVGRSKVVVTNEVTGEVARHPNDLTWRKSNEWKMIEMDSLDSDSARLENSRPDEKMKTKKRERNRSRTPRDDHGWSNGQVINLVSTDAHRIDQCLSMLHVVWTSPIIILICMALLIVNLSYSALSGLACLILVMIILIITAKPLYVRVQGINAITDARVSLTVEILQAIRTIKYFCWEESFGSRLANLRAKETRAIQRYMTIRNAVTALGQSLPVLAAMGSFITFALASGRRLSPDVIFSSSALFASLLMPTAYLPGCVGQAADAWGSLKKIEAYLLSEDAEILPVDVEMREAINLEEAGFTWETGNAGAKTGDFPFKTWKTPVKENSYDRQGQSKETTGSTSSADTTSERRQPQVPFALHPISLSIQRGELFAVIGRIGSGKTSLLSALAGDMRKTHGSVTFSSQFALCSQVAWIQNTTVRDNILFGTLYDHTWYQEVISACQLVRDLEILPDGDSTEIGERGINLSGGQKQRISLARAIYSKVDILLLDDPLSAMDPHVGQAVFQEAILGLLGDKTRILATHQASILRRCDRLLWLEEGRVQALGTFDKLVQSFPEVASLFRENNERHSDQSTPNDISHTAIAALDQPPRDRTEAVLIKDEERESIRIPWRVYGSFITASRNRIPAVLALPLLCLAQSANIIMGIWLTWWVSSRLDLARSTYISVYAMFPLVQGVLFYMFGICVAFCCTSGSSSMLDAAVERVMHAPVWFFDTTPLGRISNLFSKDIGVMDFILPESLRLFLLSTALILSIFVLILIFFHWFGVVLVPFIAVFLFFAAYYRASARELKRHEASLRGVVLARVSEALTGVATIRAYAIEPIFRKSVRLAIDDMNSANFLTFSNQRWLALRMDAIGMLLIVASGILTVADRFVQSPAVSGLVLSYALGSLQVLQFIVRQWTDVENAMNATERIHAYSSGGALSVEGSNGQPCESPPPSWPERGAVTFTDVQMRYRPGLPQVLQGFTLTVRAGEHVAIVGRTGAGKSSLIAALFRMCELSGGCISIDGLDISRIPLRDLRSRISIQPQDSVLFRGSVRSNLDPSGQHTDETLWLALCGAFLADRIHLDDFIQEEGSNLSHGQRQQLGLARLLVRDSKIIVCDEATSSIDLETDSKVQQTVCKLFKGKTVLTVAHRMKTVIGYDRICVMDEGKIVELGTPRELWMLGGRFRGMCDASGIREGDL